MQLAVGTAHTGSLDRSATEISPSMARRDVPLHALNMMPNLSLVADQYRQLKQQAQEARDAVDDLSYAVHEMMLKVSKH